MDTIFKPEPWAINPAEIAPEWSWFWQGHTGDNLPVILPFWSHTLVEREPYVQRLAPLVSGSGWSIRQSQFGQVLRTSGNSRLRYAVGSRAEFAFGQAWSVVVGIRFTTISGDERTIFAKSSNGGVANDRQIRATLRNEAAPSAIEVKVDGITVIVTGADAIEEDIWYLIAITNDGTLIGNVKLYSHELTRKTWIDEGAVGTNTSDFGDIDEEIHLGAHFSDTNDDLIGDLLFFYYMPGMAFTKEHIRQLAFDPFGPIRREEQDRQGKAPAVGGLSIPVAMADYRRLRVG